MPTYVVTRVDVLHKVVVQAQTEREAIEKARPIFVQDADLSRLRASKQADDVRL